MNRVRQAAKALAHSALCDRHGRVSELSRNANPDKLALERTGEHVRRKLDAEPNVYKAPVEGAEIWTRGAFLNDAECERLIALIDAAAHPSGILSHGYEEVWRTSFSADLDRADPFVESIDLRIDALLGLPYDWGETIQGQRYNVGQQFRDHMDTFWTNAEYWPGEARRGGQRSFTAMIFLNEVEGGGETEFPRLGASIPPQKGVILVWNNAGRDGSLNEMTMHAGRPVTAGVKYIVTKWYRTRRWGEQ